jgi:hypothetical protein
MTFSKNSDYFPSSELLSGAVLVIARPGFQESELRHCYHMKSQECMRSEVLTFVNVQSSLRDLTPCYVVVVAASQDELCPVELIRPLTVSPLHRALRIITQHPHPYICCLSAHCYSSSSIGRPCLV